MLKTIQCHVNIQNIWPECKSVYRSCYQYMIIDIPVHSENDRFVVTIMLPRSFLSAITLKRSFDWNLSKFAYPISLRIRRSTFHIFFPAFPKCNCLLPQKALLKGMQHSLKKYFCHTHRLFMPIDIYVFLLPGVPIITRFFLYQWICSLQVHFKIYQRYIHRICQNPIRW